MSQNVKVNVKHPVNVKVKQNVKVNVKHPVKVQVKSISLKSTS